MVTQPGREALAARAIQDFRAQTWSNKQLVIVADGWPQQRAMRVWVDDLLRYSIPGKHNLGSLRNISLDLAKTCRADFICQWDDDDRYHPERLSIQVEPIIDNQFFASCLTDQFYAFQEKNKPLRMYWIDWYRRRPRFSSILIPGTIMVNGRLPHHCRYPEVGNKAIMGEDGAFLQEVANYPVAPISGKGWCYIRFCHGKNTWPTRRFISNAQWLCRDLHEMENEFGKDLERLQEYDPPLPQPIEFVVQGEIVYHPAASDGVGVG
jgi:glycosyltransferase involved in cell wall biosynthesis